jgi:hypothetical protein
MRRPWVKRAGDSSSSEGRLTLRLSTIDSRRALALFNGTLLAIRAHGRRDALGEGSDARRMEDSRPVSRTAPGRLFARMAFGRSVGHDDLCSHVAPLIGAFRPRIRGGDGERRGVRAAHSGAGTLTPLGSGLPMRRAAGDQLVEPPDIHHRIGLRAHEMIAACPGGARRTEYVERQEHKRPGSPPRQSPARS